MNRHNYFSVVCCYSTEKVSPGSGIKFGKSANFRVRWRKHRFSGMKKLIFAGILFSLGTGAYAQDVPRIRTPAKSRVSSSAPVITEKQVNYPDKILREELDFELTPVSEGKFKLNLTTQTKGFYFIKIYDVIGNLLYERKVRVRGNFQQVLDMSEHTTNFFIIEIGNEEFNKTKSIVAT